MTLQVRFDTPMDTERMVAQFLEMVQIDSESGEEAAFLAWLQPRIEEVGGTAGLDWPAPDFCTTQKVRIGWLWHPEWPRGRRDLGLMVA